MKISTSKTKIMGICGEKYLNSNDRNIWGKIMEQVGLYGFIYL
jgi:hypothetical protein